MANALTGGYAMQVRVPDIVGSFTSGWNAGTEMRQGWDRRRAGNMLTKGFAGEIPLDQAVMRASALDPAGTADQIKVWSGLQEVQADQEKRKLETGIRLAYGALQAGPDAWPQYMQRAADAGIELGPDWQEYNPDRLRAFIAGSMPAEDIAKVMRGEALVEALTGRTNQGGGAVVGAGQGVMPLDLSGLSGKVRGVESGGRQFAKDGSPLTSSAGAIGTMQLLPSTAQTVAARHGIAFDPNRLNTDQAYNQQLGDLYLSDLVQRYNGDAALAVTAYHAGEGNVDHWLSKFGDPRTGAIGYGQFMSQVAATGNPKSARYPYQVLGNDLGGYLNGGGQPISVSGGSLQTVASVPAGAPVYDIDPQTASMATALAGAGYVDEATSLLIDNIGSAADRRNALADRNAGWQHDAAVQAARDAREDARLALERQEALKGRAIDLAERREDLAAAQTRPLRDGELAKYNLQPGTSALINGAGDVTILSEPGAVEPTTAERNADAMGLPPGSPERAAYIRASTLPARVSVNTNTGNPLTPNQEAVAASDAERYTAMAESFDQMAGMMPYLDSLERAVETYPTGALGEPGLFMRQLAQSIGLPVENVSEGELIQSISSRLAPAMRIPGSGASSDRDVQMFKDSLAGLSRTPEGNRAIIQLTRRIYDYRAKALTLARQFMESNRGLGAEYQQAVAALGPVLTDADRAMLMGQGSAPQQGAAPVADFSRMSVQDINGLDFSTLDDAQLDAVEQRLRDLGVQ